MNENQCKSMETKKINKNKWKSAKIIQNQRKSMIIWFGTATFRKGSGRSLGQWKPMKMNENLWKSMQFNETTWKCMKMNENQWKSMKINDNPKIYIFVKILWGIMKYYQILQNILKHR